MDIEPEITTKIPKHDQGKSIFFPDRREPDSRAKILTGRPCLKWKDIKTDGPRHFNSTDSRDPRSARAFTTIPQTGREGSLRRVIPEGSKAVSRARNISTPKASSLAE